MRFAMITSAAALLIVGASTAPAASTGSNGPATVATVSAPVTPTLLAAQDTQPQTSKGEVKVSVTETHTTTWWTDPVWVTIGVVALLVIVLLVALAARGGGSSTTVVR